MRERLVASVTALLLVLAIAAPTSAAGLGRGPVKGSPTIPPITSTTTNGLCTDSLTISPNYTGGPKPSSWTHTINVVLTADSSVVFTETWTATNPMDDFATHAQNADTAGDPVCNPDPST